MPRLKIAAAQIACRPGDIPANLATHERAIGEARRIDVDLLVFSELSLTDYLAAPDCAALAREATDSTFSRISAAAGPMAVSVGFIERGADGRPYNAQALLVAGRIAALHRKLNLPGYGRLREPDVYAPGESFGLTPLAGGWRAATLICADAWNPALPWLAALAGANLMIVPVASSLDAVGGGFDNPRGWDINLAHTSVTYGLPTIFANHCGQRGEFAFWGGSRILDATGRELARAGAAPGLVVAEIDLSDGEAARAALPTARDSDPARVRDLLTGFLSQRLGS